MNRENYLLSINKAIDFINQNLEQNLSLEKLAGIASFSPFHFQRMFKAVVGETPHEFISRLRVERACTLLLYQKEMSITDIALRSGFSSSAAFARVFKAHFGISANQYRKESKPESVSKICKESSPPIPYSKNKSGTAKQHSGHTFQVNVKNLKDYHTAYVRVLQGFDKGVYNKEFDAAFQKVADWGWQTGYVDDEPVFLGIAYDHPDITGTLKSRYDAALTIKQSVTMGEGDIGIQDVPGGLYAIIKLSVDNPGGDVFEKAIHMLGEAMDYLYAQWLPDSGYLLPDRPTLDIYHTPSFADPIVLEFALPVSRNLE